MDKAKKILKEVFGFDSFRSLQNEIIESILNKNDTLVIMPTGGGKSLCYQIPALMFNGLTLVVSPLISLMKDQVEQLRQLGINTALLNSSLTPADYQFNFENVKNGKAKLLYVAPETLVKNEILNLLQEIKLECITIDEAHCISEWGHDFRKDYRQLGVFRKNFPSAVCIALTATATPRVQKDIVNNLNLFNHNKFIASFNRENLFLQVIPKKNSFQQTIDFLREHDNQSGIIYCFSRKQVDNIHEELSSFGFSIKPYHAGLSDEERNRNQDLFIKDEIQIIVATIAFGMGINKSNVRFVLHHDLPKNIESYYQEIGRSGRDGLRSDCLLLFSYSDISKINYFIDQKENDMERLSAKAHLEAMVKYTESEVCRRIPLINYFGEKYSDSYCGMCDNCLGDEKDLTDITIPAQKFLSAVKRTGEIFGANYIIDVLTGTESERILHNGHQNLSVFGIGKEYGKKDWQRLAQQFVRKDLLNRDIEFGSLKLTDKSYNILFNDEKVFGIVKEQKPLQKKKETAGDSFDQELFELLRKKRKELADINNVPPYVIFSDKSLVEMSKIFPQDKISFLNISGVGRKKLDNYGNIFISIIKKYCSGKNIKKLISIHSINRRSFARPKYVVTAESFNNGASVEKLAKHYNVKKQTIISHLSRYANEGNKIRVEGLYSEISLPENQLKKIFNAFDQDETLSLKTVHEKFNGEVSYEDLHILRIIYLNEYIRND